MTGQRVTDEQLGRWEKVADRSVARWSNRVVLDLLSDLRASRDREAAWQQRWDFQHGVAQGWLANWKAAQQRINNARLLAAAARSLVPHAPYTGVGWQALLDALDGAAETVPEAPWGTGTPTEPVPSGPDGPGTHWCDVADNLAAQLEHAERSPSDRD